MLNTAMIFWFKQFYYDDYFLMLEKMSVLVNK